MSHHAGLAAEHRIAQDYERRGFAIARRRWKGQGGEIDLIVQDGTGLIFVEVKQSRTLQSAAESLSPRQMRRVYASAEEYLDTTPKGSLTQVRFDVALVDGSGDLQIIENAFGQG
ncbi:MAG: YraN family protein [Pseudomonadota bacterium]